LENSGREFVEEALSTSGAFFSKWKKRRFLKGRVFSLGVFRGEEFSLGFF